MMNLLLHIIYNYTKTLQAYVQKIQTITINIVIKKASFGIFYSFNAWKDYLSELRWIYYWSLFTVLQKL